jgi:two-component system chemotaxis sensor kinase CheA
MDVSQYLEIFIEETKEHLQSLSEQLLILEKEPENTETINEIFRAAHSLKGMAGTMGFKRMQKLTHNMENVFSEIRVGNIKVTAAMIDVLFQCLDALEEYLKTIQNTSNEGSNDNDPIIKSLDNFVNKTTDEAVAAALEVIPEENTELTAKYSDFVFTDFEKNAINEAIIKGFNIYKMTVFIDESSILKSARAFLVFKALEQYGEIIKSEPAVQDIEDENFGHDFSICLIAKESYKTIANVILNISEIRDVIGEPIASIEEVEVSDQESDSRKEKEAEKEVEKNKKAGQKPESKQTTAKSVVSRSVRVDIDKLDVLMNLVSELIIAKNGLVSVSSGNETEDSHLFNEQIEYLERVTTNLHESVMKVRMMPIETVTNKFPRMIRDFTKKLNKKMELYITGEETELDRTVIDEIGDPLMHLLRNSADHGLESEEVRIQRGKPEVGSIYLNAYQDGNNVVIVVKDDGNGINVEKIKNKAIKNHVITEEQAQSMQESDAIDLIFQPSFSTADVVSDISGRGVGLDVVKTKIEALGGDVEVKTKLYEGTEFIIRLPLTLAIIQALMVEVGTEKYAISLGSIQMIEEINVSDIKFIQSKEVIHLRGTVIPIIRLAEVLDIEESDSDSDVLTVVIVRKGERLAGLVVDKLIGQQEIVIKSLGKYINNNSKMIGGATILGNGDVALILDANALV